MITDTNKRLIERVVNVEVPLADDVAFKNLLIQAAREDPIMCIAQDGFFDAEYYSQAYRFFEQNQFMLSLSLLVIYDSYIHSGGIPTFLRRRFGEFPAGSRRLRNGGWTKGPSSCIDP
jgi:hypothetical protein